MYAYAMKIYLFIYNPDFGENEDIIMMLKSIDSIRDIRICLSYAILIKSSDSAQMLSNRIINLRPNRRFLITEIAINRQGWLTNDIWAFLSEDRKVEQ